MSVRFDCPSCKANYQVVDDLAGKMIMCRVCKKRGPVRSLSVAKTPAAASLPASAASSTAEPTRRNFVLIGGSVVASLAAIGLGAWLGRTQPWQERPRPRPTDQQNRRGPRRGEDGKEDGKGAPDEKGGAPQGKDGAV